MSLRLHRSTAIEQEYATPHRPKGLWGVFGNLRNDCKLLTDDGRIKDYVHKVVDGLAIGTKQFLNEIGYAMDVIKTDLPNHIQTL